MQISLTRGGCFAWIDDDPASAVVALLPQKLIEYWKGLGAVGAGDQQDFGERDVAPRIRGAIHAEGFVVARGSGDHAQPSVVIDVPRAESGARELAHQVSLLGSQRRSRIDAERVFPVLRLQLFEFRDDEI